MAIIWGFDLSEMSWGAFGHKKMFDPRWHLRKERFIVYQLAMLISLAAECTATYALSKYEDHQDHIRDASPNQSAKEHNNDLIATAVLSVVFCVLVATVFGADFFFLVFWPRRTYPRWYNAARKGLAVGISIGMGAACLMSTIVVASHEAFITGVDSASAEQYVRMFERPPLRYRSWAPNVAYVVLLWLGFISTVASTVLMFIAAAHDERYGAEPKEPGINGPTHATDRFDGNGASFEEMNSEKPVVQRPSA